MTRTLRVSASAKINLALVVGPRRTDGLHEIASVVQRVGLSDHLELEPARELEVRGFAGDTIVHDALERLAAAAGVEARWRIRLDKVIPVAAGLGGGSADAGAALLLANRTLPTPLEHAELVRIAAAVGSDVPFFLEPGPKLVEGGGERLTPVRLPQDYWIVLAAEHDVVKHSTASVYSAFDELGLAEGFPARRTALMQALDGCRASEDLARLPPNDLAPAIGAASRRLASLLREAAAIRADVSGAGPTVYGLFRARAEAEEAARTLPARSRSWVVAPVW